MSAQTNAHEKAFRRAGGKWATVDTVVVNGKNQSVYRVTSPTGKVFYQQMSRCWTDTINRDYVGLTQWEATGAFCQLLEGQR